MSSATPVTAADVQAIASKIEFVVDLAVKFIPNSNVQRIVTVVETFVNAPWFDAAVADVVNFVEGNQNANVTDLLDLVKKHAAP